ncbi:hypothetical protein AC579_5005 [Pseudocercospora musae]|uniref:Tyrosinase copper-binding domain-containing protein n=1 Tax=Pseudocercospora musae TaxID=113226 RepID=A0A139I8P4_9PEZI|nr:hypothetical protein AC579_5005 [Pseudocercospora musae]KXT10999.1 hypothetical protein AC579_5005 [Pseudocercospora musae]KXT11000.1 hypothetical protein AC579_5005 [Pseudocercospora musae]
MFIRTLRAILLTALVSLHATEAQDAKAKMSSLQDSAAKLVHANAAKGAAGSCQSQKLIVRKEWGDMSRDERLDYIRALNCLHTKPPKTDPKLAPGCKTRYDDFVVAHIMNTYNVHFSAWLLSFHRVFIWEFEKALRDECGYKGGQPYWDWSRYVDQPMERWPMFDGSDTSLGGDGHVTPTSGGCSCVTNGPFKDWTVNLGPVGDGASCKDNPQDNGLGYNPRCMERKFNPSYLANLTYDKVLAQVHGSNDINSFGLAIESWPLGVHPVPHELIGGVQDDIPASPADCWFWQHHTNLDRFWLFWASLDWDHRWNALGSSEVYNAARQERKWQPAKPISVDSRIHLSPAFPEYRVGDLFSPTGGPFCYVYQ